MNKKACWVAKHYNKGWRLGFAVGNEPIKYVEYWFKSIPEVKTALNLNIVFVHKADE